MWTGRSNAGNSVTCTYTYNGSQLSRMTFGDTVMRFAYGADGSPLSINYDGVTYYYVTNLQGDVIGILNSSGVMVVEYTYDARGRLLSTTGTLANSLGMNNPLRYRGYVYDQETELYYLQSRYYNPEWGRFINADTFISTGSGIIGQNMFAYCNNSPVSYTDPSGQSPISFISVLGQKFSKWICNLVVDECDSETTSLGEKLLRTCASFVYNLELSAGVGMGFYGETEIWDAIGLSAGMYITNISVCYENGSWQLVNEAYTGISATFLWNEVGAAEYGTRPYGGGGEWENNHWVLYNDTESSITIYSASAYFFGGGSVRVGFDLNTFLHDISNIWGVGLYARK